VGKGDRLAHSSLVRYRYGFKHPLPLSSTFSLHISTRISGLQHLPHPHYTNSTNYVHEIRNQHCGFWGGQLLGILLTHFNRRQGVKFTTSSNGTQRQDDVECPQCFDALFSAHNEHDTASRVNSLYSGAHAITHFEEILGIGAANPYICALSREADMDQNAAISACNEGARSAWASHSKGGKFRRAHRDPELSRSRCSVM
jgi:hypothetical protein